MIQFTDHNHTYSSIVPDNRIWTSVTSITGKFKEPFDRINKAAACSVKRPTATRPNKWYGISQQDILQAWDNEAKRSVELGTWYHNKRENEFRGKENVIWYTIQDGKKLCPDQKLQEGIYPEHMVYLESAGICGQSDLVTVEGNKVHIDDYKSSKEINRKSFVNWEGVSKKMLKPLHHLEDCHLTHYSLQLSLYMYMILRHNPLLVPGNMTIQHVKFEEEGQDMWGYPIYRKDDNGEYIVREIEYIPIPYLKNEVNTIINWLKN